MDSRHIYAAPWGTSFRLWTVFSVIICVAAVSVLIGLFVTTEEEGRWMILLPAVALPLSFLGMALFMVRGYELTHDALLVKRPGRWTRVELDGLVSVEVEPGAARFSVMLFGMDGVFSRVGWFRNARLGPHRSWVTDHRRVVVLRYQDRTVTVSPDRPEEFVAQVRQLRRL